MSFFSQAEKPRDWVEWAATTAVGTRLPADHNRDLVDRELAQRLLALEDKLEQLAEEICQPKEKR